MKRKADSIGLRNTLSLLCEMKRGLFITRVVACSIGIALTADPGTAAAFQTLSSSPHSAATNPVFSEQAIVGAFLYSPRRSFSELFGAAQKHILARTFGGGTTQPLTDKNYAGIDIEGDKAFLEKRDILGQNILHEHIQAALTILDKEIPEAVKGNRRFKLHVVPGSSNEGDALAYMHPDPNDPKIAVTYEFLDGLVSAAQMHGADPKDIARIVAFVLQHELLHALRLRENDGSTHKFDVKDEVLRTQGDYALIKKDFFNDRQRDLLRKVDEFTGLNERVVFIEGLSEKPKERKSAIQTLAEKIVTASTKHGHRTMAAPVSAPTLEERFQKVFPRVTHPLLRRLKSVGPFQELNGHVGYTPTAEEEELVDEVIAEFGPGHALAAMDGRRYAAIGHPVGKFSDAVATNVLTSWYNFLLKILGTQAAEGVRDSANTVNGTYGMLRLFYRQAKMMIAYANDPIEVTQRLQQLFYMACYCIASYASEAIYKLHGEEMPTLRLPDHVYMMGVTGPQTSNVKINLDVPRDQWVAENMRRAGSVRNRQPNEVRITGVLIRERHLELMNDAFKVLGLRSRHIEDVELRGFFEENADNVIQFKSMADLAQFKETVKKHHRGIVSFTNEAKGSIKMVTDGDLMANTEIVDGVADLSFWSGRRCGVYD